MVVLRVETLQVREKMLPVPKHHGEGCYASRKVEGVEVSGSTRIWLMLLRRPHEALAVNLRFA